METRHNQAVQKMSNSEATTEEQKAYHAKQSRKSGSPAPHQVNLRERADVQLALKAIQSSPEVRADKINALRVQIEAGTYAIDSRALAMKLLGLTEQDAL